MIIKLTPHQIPEYWEVIKYGVASAERRTKEDLPYYLNQVLYELLSGKAQCYFVLEKETKIIKALIVNRIVKNLINGKSILYGEYLYAFQSSNIKEYVNLVKLSCEFAKQNGCETFEFYSSNPTIWKIVEQTTLKFNLTNVERKYVVEV